MRIIAGRHRGRALQAPPGEATRPTADRARQALFDMLWHAMDDGLIPKIEPLYSEIKAVKDKYPKP